MKTNNKKRINLCQKEIISSNFPARVIGIVLVSIITILFTWFGIIDRYIEIYTLEGILEEETLSLEVLQYKNSEMDNPQDDYLRYSRDYLSSKERKIISRDIVLRKIDEYLIPEFDVARIQLTDNELVTTIYGATLGESSIVIEKMQQDLEGVIEYAKTKNAKYEGDALLSSVDMIVVFSADEGESVSFEE